MGKVQYVLSESFLPHRGLNLSRETSLGAKGSFPLPMRSVTLLYYYQRTY